jgi:hypothetical protein
LFPDQYGRIHTLQLDAEYFIEEIEKGNEGFMFDQNPFKSDIAGKIISFDGFNDDVKLQLPESLKLVPDF